jgi:CBS domain-containing protein
MEPGTEYSRKADGNRRREDSRVPSLRGPSGTAARVGDLALITVPTVPARLPMSAARKIAGLKGAPLLLAERDGVLVGVVDERALLAAADDLEVGGVMRRMDLCVTPLTPLVRARELLLGTGADALPVAAGAMLLGVVTGAAIERAVRDNARAELEVGRATDGGRSLRRRTAA